MILRLAHRDSGSDQCRASNVSLGAAIRIRMSGNPGNSRVDEVIQSTNLLQLTT